MRLHGELDVSQGAKLRRHVGKLVASGHKHVVLSMTQLDYLDSSGLGSLLALARLLSRKGGRLILVTNDFVDEILAMTRLNDVFECAESETVALQLLAQA